MTPFMKIFALLEQRQFIQFAEVIEALESRGAANRVIRQLRDRGDIVHVGRGAYAKPETANMLKGWVA